MDVSRRRWPLALEQVQAEGTRGEVPELLSSKQILASPPLHGAEFGVLEVQNISRP